MTYFLMTKMGVVDWWAWRWHYFEGFVSPEAEEEVAGVLALDCLGEEVVVEEVVGEGQIPL